MPIIRILGGSYQEAVGDKPAIIRGPVEIEGLKLLKIGSYQRQQLKPAKINAMVRHVRKGKTLPDLTFALRIGGEARLVDGDYLLDGDVFVVDGQQRRAAYLQLIAAGEGNLLQVGATVYLYTTEKWERDTFGDVNLYGTKVSANNIMGNLAVEDSRSAKILWQMSQDDLDSILYKRIQWEHYHRKGELFSAVNLAKIMLCLHGRKTPGRVDKILESLDAVIEEIGEHAFRINVNNFFTIIDQAFRASGGVKDVVGDTTPTYLLPAFLQCVARVFCDHDEFWSYNTLVVPELLVKKLGKFGYEDAAVRKQASSTGSVVGMDLLEGAIIKHLNKGPGKPLTKSVGPKRKSQGVDKDLAKNYLQVLAHLSARIETQNGTDISKALHLRADIVYTILWWYKEQGLVDYNLTEEDNSKLWMVIPTQLETVKQLLSQRDTIVEKFFDEHLEPTLRQFQDVLQQYVVKSQLAANGSLLD